MSYPSTPNPLVELRYLELGERVPDEQLIRSARHLIDQAGTNCSNDVWQNPPIKRPPIDHFSSTRFAYRQPAPNRRSLLLTVPVSPPSNIPPLLDWGSSSTELEDLGLSGLEEFRSSIKPPIGGLPVAQKPLLKRRRSIGERPQGLESSLTKKPCFAVPLPAASHLPAISAKVQNAAVSALQSKSSTRGNGSVRLRLGLTKRTNIGSKLKSNRPLDTPYDLSVKVKLIPRNQTEGPPASSVTESPGSGNSADGTLALGFKIPDSALDASRNGKLHIQLPMKAASAGAPRQPNTSKRLSTRAFGHAGRVLVPSSPSTDRIVEVPVTPGSCNPASPDNCADTSMLSNVTSSSSFLPPPAFPALSTSLLPTINRVQLRESDPSNGTSDILLSAPLSLSLEEPESSNSLAGKDTTADLSSHLDTSYDLKPNQLMASVFYDSSQDSNSSQPGQPTYSPSPLADISTTSTNHESPPWDLSQQDDQGEAGYYADHHPRSSMSFMATKPTEAHSSDPENPHINDCSFSEIDSSVPKMHHSKPSLISVLYDSSQDSPRLQPRNSTPSNDHDQGDDKDSIDGDVSIPRPSWSPDVSPRTCSNHLLSNVQPSSSWGSLPGRTGVSPDDLVSASRSLSLEDFETRRPPNHELCDESPAQSKPPTPLRLSPAHHSNIPVGPTSVRGICNVSYSLGSRTPAEKRSGMSRLASYASAESSLVGSHSPILSFTPLPKQDIPNNSLESIESPDTTQRIDAGKSFRPNPIFKFPFPKPTPELEDDISFESQALRPKLTSTPHGARPPSQLARMPDAVPRLENNALRGDSASRVPNSDGVPAHEQKAVDGTENTTNQKILQSDVPPPAPDHPSLLTPQPQPPSPLVSKIYKGHLHAVIPQPHFLPCLPCPQPSLAEGMLASLIPPSFQNWLDKDGKVAQDQAAAAANFSSDTWGRAAWIIPVRGRPPWDGCSGALVSLRPIRERKKKLIVWTPASLRSFWTQMAGFRDTKRVGSLSMSFEAVPGKPSVLEVPKQPSELKASQSFEFIKLYHDARVSLKLRTILQVLEFSDEDRYGIDADVPKEGELGIATTRRLLGASTRLALLDSTGHIVLMS